MAIYTKKGDKGETSLYGGTPVSKSDQRIRSIGTIDELSSQLGVVSSLLSRRAGRWLGEPFGSERVSGPEANQGGDLRRIKQIQQDLFEIASELAQEAQKPPFKFARAKIVRLERLIDKFWSKLPPLGYFIYPGGTQVSAQLHVARSVARRAEREVVELVASFVVNPNILAYLNRLSDFLFTLALWVNRQARVEEKIWPGFKKRRAKERK